MMLHENILMSSLFIMNAFAISIYLGLEMTYSQNYLIAHLIYRLLEKRLAKVLNMMLHENILMSSLFIMNAFAISIYLGLEMT